MQQQGTIVEKEGQGSLNIMLHPLVLIHISDHWTRTRVQGNDGNPRVIGALIGQQNGRTVEIVNAFELVHDVVGGVVVIDQKYLTSKSEQLKKVFPNYDFLGWYSTGDGVQAADMEIHKQIIEFNENPLYLLLNPLAASTGIQELPITILESELRVVNDQPTMFFVKVPYKIETGEAERISVDHVARITPSGSSAASHLTSHLLGVHNAVSMLSLRVKIILNYLQLVKNGQAPKDHGLLRRAASLANQLPITDTPSFKEDFINEYNDALMITYLASITKGSNNLNELIDRYNLTYDRQSKRRSFF